MRSYETARRLYSILAFFAWVMMIGGVLVAVVAAKSLSAYAPPGTGLLAAAPGFGIGFTGLLLLAIVQNARATVDTAELTQQMLKVARDQLEVSQQSLKQGILIERGFEALKQTQPSAPMASFADAAQTKFEAAETKNNTPIAPPPEPTATRELAAGETEYAGRIIKEEDGSFIFAKLSFDSLAAAHRYIDQLGVNPKAVTGNRVSSS